MRRSALFLLPLAALFPLAFSCAQIAGLEDHELSGAGGSAGTGGPGGTSVGGGSTSSSSSSTGGSAAGGSSGTGGSSGPCGDGETQPCYTGPPGTADIGICQSGTQQCGPNGTWGPCNGEVFPATEDCATVAVDESCDGSGGCDGVLAWAKLYGAMLHQNPTAVAATPDGGLVVALTAEGDFDFDGLASDPNGSYDAVLVRLDSVGNALWQRRFGDAGIQAATSVAVRPDGVILLGGFGEGAFSLGGPTITPAAGKLAGFVGAFGPEGNHLWTRSYTATGGSEVNALAVGLQGDAVVVGHDKLSQRILWLDRLDGMSGAPVFGGPITFNANDNLSLLTSVQVQLPSGEITVAGFGSGGINFGNQVVTPPQSALTNAFVARFNASGQHLWSHAYGGAGDERWPQLALTPNGGVIVGVTSSSPAFDINDNGAALTGAGGSDVVLFGLTPSGDTVWSLHYGDSNDQSLTGLAVDHAGNFVFAGNTAGDFALGAGYIFFGTSGEPKRYLAKMSPGAPPEVVWGGAYDAGSLQEGFADTKLATGPFGTILGAAPLRGTISLGAGTLLSFLPDDADALIFAFGP